MARDKNSYSILGGALLALIIAAFFGSHRAASAQDDGEHLLYLPLIATAEEEVTVPNGDFEAGRTAWTESSKWGNVLIVPEDDLPPGIAAHGGSWAAWLGGDNDEEAILAQTVTIDPATPYLAFWYWIDWPFSCQGASGAVATVWLDQTMIHQTDVCEDTDSGGWAQRVLDVSAFAGQTVDLRFQLITGVTSYANLYLDDVRLQASPR